MKLVRVVVCDVSDRESGVLGDGGELEHVVIPE
jgi:hypothetical protein